jgi:hypothetical protein
MRLASEVTVSAASALSKGAERWPQCKRLLLILSAASLSWLAPMLAVYFLLTPH